LKAGVCTCDNGPFDPATKNCGVCPVGKTWNKAAQTCRVCTDTLCTKCDLTGGTTGDNCKSCGNGYTLNNVTGSCACNGGYIRSNDSLCFTCQPRQYFDDRSCLGCQEQFCADCSLSSNGSCSACLPTFTLGLDAKCRCPTNTAYNKMTNTCVPVKVCPDGFYNPGTNQCVKCAQAP